MFSQALAGLGLPDRVCDGPSRHAEAAGGGLALAAQFPSWHRVLLRRSGARPASSQSKLPQVSHL